MSRPRNTESTTTTIQVTWDQKDRMSVHRQAKDVSPGKKPRNEKDPELFERILAYYEKDHPVKNPVPKSTIPNDSDNTKKSKK